MSPTCGSVGYVYSDTKMTAQRATNLQESAFIRLQGNHVCIFLCAEVLTLYKSVILVALFGKKKGKSVLCPLHAIHHRV